MSEENVEQEPVGMPHGLTRGSFEIGSIEIGSIEIQGWAGDS